MEEKDKIVLKKKIKKIKKQIKKLEKLYKLNPKKSYIDKMFKLGDIVKKMKGGVKKRQKKNSQKSAIKDRLASRKSTLMARPVFHILNTREVALREKNPKKKMSRRPSASSFKKNLHEKKAWMTYRYVIPTGRREREREGQWMREQTVGFGSVPPQERIIQRFNMAATSNFPIFERPRADYQGGFFGKRKPIPRPRPRPRPQSSAHQRRKEIARYNTQNQRMLQAVQSENFKIQHAHLNPRKH